MMGRYVEQLQNCPCGNIVGLVGIDGYILKTGTITTHKEAYNFKTMKYSVAAVVRVSVEPKNAKDLPKLVEGLKKLAKSDPLVQIITTKTGEKIIAGAGELHLEICLKDLRDDFMKGAPIKIGKPVVPLCETVTEESSMTCVSKSPNKHNRVYLTAEPIEQELQDALEDQELKMEMEEKKRIRCLVDEHQWDKQEARKLWAVGVKGDGVANMIVDTTKGVQYLNEVRDHICTAFHQVCE
jgi:elongation factor 2